MPQLPTTTVVTPCDSLGSMSGVRMTLVSSCVCTSMKPGASARPAPSTCSRAGAAPSGPIAAMRPAARATSAWKPAAPLPSSTCTPPIRVSYIDSVSQRQPVGAAAVLVQRQLDAAQPFLGGFLTRQGQLRGQDVDGQQHGVARRRRLVDEIGLGGP